MQALPNFYVCVIYFSLPGFPDSCKLVKYRDLAPRDVLLCNRINDHHIKGGMQYDPHLESAEYSICEPKVRRSLQNNSVAFNKMFILFRTRYFDNQGSSRYLVTGFYDVEKKFDRMESREAPIIYARTMHFVSVKDSIDISEKMEKERAYRCSFTSNCATWKEDLATWVAELSKRQNQTDRYIEEINGLKKIFKENEFENKNYSQCTNCEYSSIGQPCPLTWRRSHRKMPLHPANYLHNLEEFFELIKAEERKPIR